MRIVNAFTEHCGQAVGLALEVSLPLAMNMIRVDIVATAHLDSPLKINLFTGVGIWSAGSETRERSMRVVIPGEVRLPLYMGCQLDR